MSVDEMKKLIHQQIETLTDTQLQDVNTFIETINNHSVINLSQHYNIVKEQYTDVLKKLAQ